VGWQRRPACLPAGTDLRIAADMRGQALTTASRSSALRNGIVVANPRRSDQGLVRVQAGDSLGWRGCGVAIAMPWTTPEGSSWRAPCTALEIRSNPSQAGPAGGSAAGTTATCRRRPCRGEVPSATSGRTPPPGGRLPHPPSPDNSALDMAAGHRSSPASRLPRARGRHCFGQQAHGGCHQTGRHRNPSQPRNWRAGDCQVPDGRGHGSDPPELTGGARRKGSSGEAVHASPRAV
jgi:hypothetical protein